MLLWLIKYCTYNNILTGTLVHQGLLLEVSYCSASKLFSSEKTLGLGTTSLLGWLIQNECRSWDAYGSPMAKNIYGLPMAKNIYGLPMAQNINDPSIAENTLWFRTLILSMRINGKTNKQHYKS